jgi:hypothetical protein
MNTYLQPGTLVRLKNQPVDMPDFVLDQYQGETCSIRQQSWGDWVQWTVKTSLIEPDCVRISPCVRLEIS